MGMKKAIVLALISVLLSTSGFFPDQHSLPLRYSSLFSAVGADDGVEDDEDASANPNEGVDDADDGDAPNKGVEDVDELNIEEDAVGFEIENGDGDEDDEVKVDKLEEKVKPDIVDA
ncbi:hypothetical protein L2E82_02055 [Cichorium intybus]|uniref:Uncharacterized protein n=1 Tax=Cichorium intybus TaxID=13427 RepID=A0ACB9H0A0_CICIN|nr:hypothetical protein L2E82_02055 [Cichorium intybus]